MSVYLGFLDALIRSQDPLALYRHNITDDYFTGLDEAVAYRAVCQHIERYGSLPTKATIQIDTGIHIPDYPEDLSYWLDVLNKAHLERILRQGISGIVNRISDGKIYEAEEALGNLFLKSRQITAGEDTRSLQSLHDQVMSEHDKRQRSPDMLGIPFGIPSIDEVSDGAQPGDLTAVVGRLGKGKTYLMLKFAHTAHLFGKRVLFVSYEMSLVQIARRLYALASGIPAEHIRLGQVGWLGTKRIADMVNGQSLELIQDISTDSLTTLIENGRGIRSDVPFNLMKGSFASTVEDLAITVKQMRPDVVYIDGAYLLRSRHYNQSRNERITYTCEYLKILAQDIPIPVIASYQFNRQQVGKEASVDYIYMSDAIGQLASLALGLDDDPSQRTMGPKSEKLITIMKGREGERGNIHIMYDMDQMKIYELERDEYEE